MKKIDTMIIGAQKCGTTTVYDWLAQHPRVYLPQIKEVHYFVRDEFYQQGESYLEPLYRGAAEGQLLGGAYAHLMFFPEAVKRLLAHNHQMKIVAVLRNPIDRAYSAYWFARRNGWEHLETFEEALAAEDHRQAGSWMERTELTYLTHGRYAMQLAPYFESMERNQIHVIVTDDLHANPAAVFDTLQQFLGLSERVGLTTHERRNESSVARWKWLQARLLSHDSPAKRLYRRLVPQSSRVRLREKILTPLENLNVKPFRYPGMSEETRSKLCDHFAEENRQLWQLLDRPEVPWS